MMTTTPSTTTISHARSTFISDVHLGTPGCKADALLDFLQTLRTERLFLVGDIIDLQRMQQSVYWPDTHSRIVREVFRKAQSGTEVYFIPGNHDAELRNLAGSTIHGVHIRLNLIHETADGRRLLVTHGDQFDAELRIGSLKERLGSAAYQWLVDVDAKINQVRSRFGYDRVQLASAVKMKIASARRYIDEYECLAQLHAKRRGLDGIVCGHIHKPACIVDDGIAYYNDGDWVEHCSALIEDARGEVRSVSWTSDREPAVAPFAA